MHPTFFSFKKKTTKFWIFPLFQSLERLGWYMTHHMIPAPQLLVQDRGLGDIYGSGEEKNTNLNIRKRSSSEEQKEKEKVDWIQAATHWLIISPLIALLGLTSFTLLVNPENPGQD
jgi:hypothetical protein